MKKVIICLILFTLFGSCKKTIDKMKENAVISAMTDGQWVITNFVRNGTTITPEFSDYTVEAIKNNVVENTGTWQGDANAMTITANFSTADTPISHINGIWHIDNNSWTFVVASQNAGGETKALRLEKL